MTDERNPTIPSTHRGPRYEAVDEQSGVGTPRSADDGLPEPGAIGDRDAPVDPAVVTGATTSSDRSAEDNVDINRGEDEPSPS